jgi:S1-C subfamily serine protease
MTGSEGIQLLQSFSNAVAELADAVSPSVVNIGTGRRSGTGVVWSDGLIVTASHVIGGAEDPTVVLSDGRELKSKVVGRDNYTDVALLRVEEDGLKPIQTGSSGETRVGQFVLAMANAFGSKPAATWGIVTSRSRSMRGWWGITIEDAVVTDAKLNPGYSGGPLVDASGRMLGMNVAYFAGRGVAVSIDSLKDIVGKLSKDGRIKKGFLGVVVEPVELPDEVTTSQGVGQEEGLLVRAVEPGSPARNAGVTLGDVILRLGDAKATDEYQLHRALSGEVVGRTTSLWILRGEKLTELKITPQEASE